MIGRKLKGGGDLTLLRAGTHQRGFAARAERQRKGVEQDRFPRAGLAGQRGKPRAKIDVEASQHLKSYIRGDGCRTLFLILRSVLKVCGPPTVSTFRRSS